MKTYWYVILTAAENTKYESGSIKVTSRNVTSTRFFKTDHRFLHFTAVLKLYEQEMGLPEKSAILIDYKQLTKKEWEFQSSKVNLASIRMTGYDPDAEGEGV